MKLKLIALLLCICASINAETINFTGENNPQLPRNGNSDMGLVFNLKFVGAKHAFTNEMLEVREHDTRWVELTRQDGASFDINMFDFDANNGSELTVTADRSGELGESALYTVSDTEIELNWTNIIKLTFHARVKNAFIDNIVLNEPIVVVEDPVSAAPEPSAYALMILGFCGLLGCKRLKRRATS